MTADTGQSVERVGYEINRDYRRSAAEAKDYGLIDVIHGQTGATAAADRARAYSGQLRTRTTRWRFSECSTMVRRFRSADAPPIRA